MKQYCRYCNNFVTGNGNYCEAKEIEPSDSYAKSVNHCKCFEFNPIDAYGENQKGYQPRKAKQRAKQNDGNQIMMDLEEQ